MGLLVENRGLLDAFRDGEEQALRCVYREYAPKVARYARWNFEMSYFDVSDVTQLTFTRAFRPEARLAYDGVRPYLNYILRVAHNVAVNELHRAWRKHETFPEHADDGWFEKSVRDGNQNAEEQVATSEQRALLERLVCGLSAQEFLVFEKRFVAEMSQEQTAGELGLTRQRVRTIEQQIRRKAFKMFKNSGFVPAGVAPATALLLVAAWLRGWL